MRTFGNTTVGASWDWRSANVLVGRSVVFTAGGVLKDISAYLKEDRSGALNVKGVITDSTGHILTNGVSLPALISAEGWIKMGFSTPPTVVMGTTYILWVIPDSGVSNKPIMIAETGCAESGGDKAAWITSMATELESFPRIASMIWFNYNKENDWRIESSAGAQAAFVAEIT